eukprot:CAMPEP_0168259350 /NCGR_PEP_ID=MMETSP0141_2-20121125/7687_1 /TAXON_ID=44445 /ORGANISM="Pseudo-nitzschia australis, Strain 10249 10 AB" /LENGTH=65 /DNA_ID=CAMNT_0008196803 /DNA_START=204 /DNA_END=396 /DNA_ORIENTATION=+
MKVGEDEVDSDTNADTNSNHEDVVGLAVTVGPGVNVGALDCEGTAEGWGDAVGLAVTVGPGVNVG